ncbi:MAG: hypothetical protein M3247_04530 [Thermoproteota archaeon]|nr:hypothetical protein [Thermoproteota archaeon]
MHKFIDEVIINELQGSEDLIDALKNNKEMIIRAVEKYPREMKRFTNNIILAKSIFNKPLSNLIAVQALRFHPEWNRLLAIITDEEIRKSFFSDFKNLDINDEQSKTQFLKISFYCQGI